MPSSSADGIQWDLSDLYKGPEDPKIEEDIKEALNKAEKFQDKYKGKLKEDELNPKELRKAIEKYEDIKELIGGVNSYAQLLYSENTQDQKRGALLQRSEQKQSEVNNKLIFFELEWQNLEEEKAKGFIESEELEKYKSFLEHLREYKPYKLNEREEQLIESLQNTGKKAFERLFEEIIGSIEIEIEVEGEKKEMVLQEALSILYDPDRKKRIKAKKAITETLKEKEHLISFIFNNVVQNHATISQFRDYPDPMTSRNLDNWVSMETVEALLEACEQRTDMVEKYYELKKEILDYDELYDYDRYSPLPGDIPETSFEQSKEKVLESYDDFSSDMAQIAEKFFENNWIHAELSEGKRGGAFSSGTIPSAHPYILLNFTDKSKDTMTMAHELGHGIHQYLARDQGYLQFMTPLTTAEMASVFGETLMFEKLIGETEDPEEKLVLLGRVIEGDFSTVFRQAIMARFEQNLHEARKEEGELSTERINELWLDANEKEFGDSVKLTDDYGWWWSYVHHFVKYPFYVYAYSFGELLVLALYQEYQERGEEFVPKYIDLLKKGGSEYPEDMLKEIGLDITEPDFWHKGLDLLEKRVNRIEKLAEEAGRI